MTGLGVWIVSPRFGIGGPSLVDDWSAISRSPHQLSRLGELLNPGDNRFRPGWVVWNYLDWHTLGAPAHMAGPTLWALARLVLFVAGVTVAAAALTGISRNGRADPTDLMLVALPSAAVLAAPWAAVDFARLGPQEPLLVGSMTLGGVLLCLGARDVVRGAPVASRAAPKLAAGYVLWAFGVYQKEVSVCALALLACLLVAGRARAREELRRLTRSRRRVLAGLAAAALLPLAHVALEVGRIVAHGRLVYDARVRPGGLGETLTAITRLGAALGTPSGYLLLLAAILGAAATIRARTPDWIQIGLLVTALAALAFSAQTDVLVSRYYIPSLVLLAIGAARATLALRRPARTAVASALLVASLASLGAAHHRVSAWAAGERNGTHLVTAVAGLDASGCRVAEQGLDPERTLSLPVLVALRHPSAGPCRPARAYLVSGTTAPPAGSPTLACIRGRRIGAYDTRGPAGLITVDRCDRLVATLRP